jgi:hypothetical protein
MFSKTTPAPALAGLIGLCIVALLVCFNQQTFGQATTAKPATDQGKKKNQKGPQVPAPEPLQLETKDGVQLRCTYFGPATQEGSESDGTKVVPYLVLHDWGSSRKDVEVFANFLRLQGNAVLTPDLRGHGESLDAAGVDKELDHKKFRQNEIASVLLDIERCKKQLVQLNDAGKLNIDMLTVVAIGKTVPLATQWVIKDWFDYPPYNKDGIKQAQDVKLLVMISPEKNNGPFKMTRLINHRLFEGEKALPTVVMWGTNSDQSKNVASIFKKLEKNRPDPKETGKEKWSLFPAKIPSSASGKQLIADKRSARAWMGIHQIATTKIGQIAEELPWKSRTSKKKKVD